ncbi:hypothetical protein, partial [Streptomyces niveiscabiei]|uniref:hypothetical protein n=1 Tax=Streptomyces niveiscabiei TaxID=164115 RepID=UPI0038F66E66
RGDAMVEELAAAPWDVVGDLEDLRPDRDQGDGVDPDAVPEAEVLAVAVDFIAAELQERATPSRAVPQPHSAPSERGSRTALR